MLTGVARVYATLVVIICIFCSCHGETVCAETSITPVTLTDTEAVCADGSRAMYYISPGSSKNFIVWLGDNELCANPIQCEEFCQGSNESADCISSPSAINSSNFECYYQQLQCSSSMYPLTDMRFSTLLCDEEDLSSVTRVYIPSCTLDWHLGRGDQIEPTNNYFHGADVVDAVFADLAFSYNLTSTSSVIIGGTRGGGIGAVHHAERLSTGSMVAVDNVRTILDSAWLLNHPQFAVRGYSNETRTFQYDTDLKLKSARWINGAPLAQDCNETIGQEEGLHRCLYISNVLSLMAFQYIPSLILQSQFEMTQLSELGVTDSDLSSSFVDSTEYAQAIFSFITGYGMRMRQGFERMSNTAINPFTGTATHYVWSPACAQYGWILPVMSQSTSTREIQLGTIGTISYQRIGSEWSSTEVHGLSAKTIILEWIFNGTVQSSPNVENGVCADRCGEFLCGASCPSSIDEAPLESHTSSCEQSTVRGYALFVIGSGWLAFLLMRGRILLFDITCRRFRREMERGVNEKGISESKEHVENIVLKEARETNKGRSIHLMLSKVSYWAPAKKRSAPPVRILDTVSVVFKPGTVHALLGPSGSGKSTLLDLLSYTREAGRMTGQHMINGVPSHLGRAAFLREWLRNSTSYVRQTDVLFPKLTVRQHLQHAAWLQLPQFATDREKLERVEQIIKLLELESCADTVCGDGGILIEGGISGGQRRRVSVATQLLSMPAALLLDEPTSGLDSTNALLLVKSLTQLAHNAGINIILTIHQPRREIFNLLDQVTILMRGQIVFSGAPNTAGQFFDVPLDEVNIGDEILDKLQGASESIIERYRVRYEQGPLGRKVQQTIEAERTRFSPELGRALRKTLVEHALASGRWSWSAPISVLTAFWVLMSRTIKRGGFDIFRTALFALFAGVLVGVVFTKSDTYTSQIALAYLSTSTLTFLASVFLGDRYNLEKGTWSFERANGNMVPFQAFLLSVFSRNMVAATIESLCYSIPLYYMSFYFQDDIEKLYNFLLLMVLTSVAVTSQNTMVEIFVIERGGEASDDTRKAALVNMSLMALSAVLNGFIINLEDIPIFLRWISYLMITLYGFAGTLINSLGDEVITEDGLSKLEQAQRAGSNVIRAYDLGNFDVTTCIFALLLIVILYHVTSVLVFFFLYVFQTNHLKREIPAVTRRLEGRGSEEEGEEEDSVPYLGKTGESIRALVNKQLETSGIAAPDSHGLVFTFLLSRQMLTIFLVVDIFLAGTLCAFTDGETSVLSSGASGSEILGGLKVLSWSQINVGFMLLNAFLFLVYLGQFFVQIFFLVPASSLGLRSLVFWVSRQDFLSAILLFADALAIFLLIFIAPGHILLQIGLLVLSRVFRFGFVLCYYLKVNLFHRSRARKLKETAVEGDRGGESSATTRRRDSPFGFVGVTPPPGLLRPVSTRSPFSARFQGTSLENNATVGVIERPINLGPMWRAYQSSEDTDIGDDEV